MREPGVGMGAGCSAVVWLSTGQRRVRRRGRPELRIGGRHASWRDVSSGWPVFRSRIRACSETWSLAQGGISATSPCSGQRIDGSRAVTNASNAIMSGWRQVPSVNSIAWQARPHCGHGNREPARKPRRRSTRQRSKSISLPTTRHGGSSCNASSKAASCSGQARRRSPTGHGIRPMSPSLCARHTHVRGSRRARYPPLHETLNQGEGWSISPSAPPLHASGADASDTGTG